MEATLSVSRKGERGDQLNHGLERGATVDDLEIIEPLSGVGRTVPIATAAAGTPNGAIGRDADRGGTSGRDIGDAAPPSSAGSRRRYPDPCGGPLQSIKGNGEPQAKEERARCHHPMARDPVHAISNHRIGPPHSPFVLHGGPTGHPESGSGFANAPT